MGRQSGGPPSVIDVPFAGGTLVLSEAQQRVRELDRQEIERETAAEEMPVKLH